MIAMTQQLDRHFTTETFLVLLSSMPLDLSMYRYTVIIHFYAVSQYPSIRMIIMIIFLSKTSKTSKAKSAGSPVQNALIFLFYLF